MKKTILILLLAVLSFSLFGQEIRVIQQDTFFRFEKYIVNDYPDFTDTIVTERLPDVWLDSAAANAYLLAEVDKADIRIFRYTTEAEKEAATAATAAAAFDQINGAGAYNAHLIAELEQAVAGNWSITARNGAATTTAYIFTENKVLLTDSTEVGAYTVLGKNNIEVVLTGPPLLNLVFRDKGKGYTARRGQVIYFLRRR